MASALLRSIRKEACGDGRVPLPTLLEIAAVEAELEAAHAELAAAADRGSPNALRQALIRLQKLGGRAGSLAGAVIQHD